MAAAAANNNKEREREREQVKDRKMLVGVVWNCAAELKVVLSALLFLCTIATLVQFLPSHFFPLSPSDFRLCLSSPLSPPPDLHLHQDHPPPPPPHHQDDELLINNSVIKRRFNGYGSAAYNFIQMGAYRGGLNTFAVVGLSSKPLHVYGNPSYLCEWLPTLTNATSVSVGTKMLTDWGYGRVYTVVVVNCTFADSVGEDGSGGKLVIYASTGGTDFNLTDRIESLIEEPNTMNPIIYTSPPKYDYLYCGSSLYGNLSPQRIREWIAYHVRFFGPRSHFVIHDAGGVHEEVLEVLRPWMELGYVTLQDIREQERFDGYYHNQFLVVNDCLHRYKFMAKWIFFFDVDEFIYVPPKSTIKTVLDSLSDFTQFTIEQMPMSNKLCLSEDAGKTSRKWGFEKLVYKDVKKGIRRDRKYAVQPRNVLATGVHMSQHVTGKTTHKTEQRIKYFHYHGTISERRETCKTMINSTSLTSEETPYDMDITMRNVAGTVKRFELKNIGTRLQRTRQ